MGMFSERNDVVLVLRVMSDYLKTPLLLS